MITELREWTMLFLEAGIFYYVALEFYYDKEKDELKKQKKTRTSKKTTQDKDGGSTIEEVTETSEPLEFK